MAKKSKKGIFANFKTAAEIIKEEKNLSYVPVGPILDDAFGGGLSERTLLLIRTKAKSGKTCLCMNIARNALLQGRRVFFFDVENRLNSKKYFSLEGFDPEHPNFFVHKSDEDKVFSGEEILSEQLSLMRNNDNRGAVYIIDSFSKIVNEECLIDPEVKGNRRSTVPKLQTDWLNKASALIRTSNSIVCGIQHLQLDQGISYGVSYKALGANGFDYEGDIVLTSQSAPADLDGNTQFGEEDLKGLTLKLRIPFNKLKGPINTKKGIETYLKFDEGIYFAREMAEILKKYSHPDPDLCEYEDPDDQLSDFKKMLSGENWYEFNLPDLKLEKKKVQGSKKVLKIIEENKEYFKDLQKKLMIQLYDANYDFVPIAEQSEAA